MAKKGLIAVVLAVCIVGGVFAQDFDSAGKNTIVVDIGPTIIGLLIGSAGDMIGGGEGLSSSGFGIAAQYERQLTEQFSVAGRFAYLGGGMGMEGSYTEGMASAKTQLSLDMSAFSLEAHGRFYPWGKAFFLDGMLGFANMSVGFNGDMVVEANGQKEKVSLSLNASHGFFKLGAKLGWRICFGSNNSGFTFEPALGYSAGIGVGDTVGQQLADDLKKKTSLDVQDSVDDVDLIFGYIEDFIFIGGPRLTLCFGWRF